MTARLLAIWTLLPALLASVGVGSLASAQSLKITYLANEGFLIESDGTRVLVDALFGEGLEHYAAVPAPERAALEGGRSPWQGIDLVLATHHHPDHFDPEPVSRFLAANPRARFVSTPQAVDLLERRLPPDDERRARIRGLLPEPGTLERLDLGDVAVDVLQLHHGAGTEARNLGFLLHLEGADVLHVGDTEASWDEGFASHADLLAEVDVALLPLWFFTEGRWGEVVRRLPAATLVAMHIAEAGAPPLYFGSAGSRERRLELLRERHPGAQPMVRSGQRVDLGADEP